MATPLNFTLTQQTFPVGTTHLGPWNFPVGYQNGYIVIDRTQLNALAASVSMDTQFEASWDSGTTWRRVASTILHGGSRVDPETGLTVMTDDLYVGGIQQPNSSTRRIRGTLVVTGASVSFSGTLSLT